MTESAGESERGSHVASWLRLSEGLIGGIHHALNNRMGALSGASQVLEADLPRDHPLSGTMGMELTRFEETATLLRLLMGGEGEFEPVQIEEVIEGARRLFDIHHGLRDLRLEVTSEANLLPLWTQPAGLLRAMLLMLAAAGARCDPAHPEVRMTISGDEATVRIAVDHDGGDGDEKDGENGSLRVDPTDLTALATLLGGEFRGGGDEGGVRWVLTLPTLPEVRRRERR